MKGFAYVGKEPSMFKCWQERSRKRSKIQGQEGDWWVMYKRHMVEQKYRATSNWYQGEDGLFKHDKMKETIQEILTELTTCMPQKSSDIKLRW